MHLQTALVRAKSRGRIVHRLLLLKPLLAIHLAAPGGLSLRVRTMWPTISVRYSPLDRGPLALKYTLARRGNIFIILLVFALVIVVGAARIFDLQVAFASKRPHTLSPEIPPEGSISSATSTAVEHSLDTSPSPYTPTHVPATSFSKEHLSIEEIKTMVSQTRGFYTRDYSLGLGWNNARPLFRFTFFRSYNIFRFAIS